MRQDRRSALPHRRPAGAPQRREYVVGYATTPGSRTEIWRCVRPRFFREALWPRTDHTGKVCTTSACRPVYRRLTCTYIDLRSSQKFAFIAVPRLSTQFGALKRRNVHCDLAESDRLRPTHTSPPLTPAPIPSAVDPHTVERAWFMASRWSAPLYERPGRPGPRLLGSAWVDGGRDGSTPRTPPTSPQPGMAPTPSRCRPIPRRRHCLDRGPLYAVVDSWPPALSTCGRASAQRGRSGPEAGAAPAAEPGARPAERSAAGA